MDTCQKRMIPYMHAYLDGEISAEEEAELNEHLSTCPDCREMMGDMTRTLSFLNEAEPVQAPDGFVAGVMARLPKEKKQAGIHRLLRRHPLLAAAALFFLLMSATLFTNYNNSQQFSFTKQPNLIVEGETVIVPAGETIKGDLVVKNGNLRIEGEVDGDVIVIRGSKFMASTAVVTGSSEEIDEMFDWLWYKIKSAVKDVIPSSKKEDTTD